LAGKLGFPIFEVFTRCIKRLGYKVFYKILNAADFGVPQRRQRLLIVAVDSSLKIDFEFPKPEYSSHPAVGPFLKKVKCNEPDEYPNGKWGNLIRLVPPGWNYLWFTERGGGPKIFKPGSRYWIFLLKLHPKRPSWTIPARPGSYDGPFHWKGRRLKIAEVKRIQCFPDDWSLVGGKRTQWLLLGEATPPPLAYAVGKKLAQILRGA